MVTLLKKPAGGLTLSRKKILIVDDEENARFGLSKLLSQEGYEVDSVGNGYQALDFLRQQRVDLVISDIKMPDRTGYDVFATARKRSDTLPVILMTGFGYDPNHSIVRASQEGLQAVLFKPFKVQQLLEEIRRAFSQHPAPAEI
jgi:two-component system, sensor histidine kinase SagS